jgi:hypothetical protein
MSYLLNKTEYYVFCNSQRQEPNWSESKPLSNMFHYMDYGIGVRCYIQFSARCETSHSFSIFTGSCHSSLLAWLLPNLEYRYYGSCTFPIFIQWTSMYNCFVCLFCSLMYNEHFTNMWHLPIITEHQFKNKIAGKYIIYIFCWQYPQLLVNFKYSSQPSMVMDKFNPYHPYVALLGTFHHRRVPQK